MDKKEMILNLMQLDRDFCSKCQKNGAEGWIQYFSDDAIMISSGEKENIVGIKDIYSSMEKVFELKEINFTWEPKICDISDDLLIGYTAGTYVRKYKIGDVLVEQKGKYNSIWKLINGDYKIVLDIGN